MLPWCFHRVRPPPRGTSSNSFGRKLVCGWLVGVVELRVTDDGFLCRALLGRGWCGGRGGIAMRPVREVLQDGKARLDEEPGPGLQFCWRIRSFPSMMDSGARSTTRALKNGGELKDLTTGWDAVGSGWAGGDLDEAQLADDGFRAAHFVDVDRSFSSL